MIHRHLEVPDGTPPEAQPLARIVDLLQRGDLDDWRPIARAIRRDPAGQFAERVLRLLRRLPDLWDLAAVASLDRPLSQSAGDRCATRRRGDWLRSAGVHGLTQVELAGRMGISQSDLSKLERRPDVRLSTLRAYATALDGGISIVFRSNANGTPIQLGSDRTEDGATDQATMSTTL